MAEITSIEGFDFSDMASAVADSNRPALDPGKYLAVVNKVTLSENENTGSVSFVFDLRINRNGESLDRWDDEAGTVKHTQFAWYGKRTSGGWTFDKNGKPGYLPGSFFSALDANLSNIDLKAQTGRVLKVQVIHEQDYQDETRLRLAVKNVYPFIENGVKAPRLPGFEEALASQEVSEDAF